MREGAARPGQDPGHVFVVVGRLDTVAADATMPAEEEAVGDVPGLLEHVDRCLEATTDASEEAAHTGEARARPLLALPLLGVVGGQGIGWAGTRDFVTGLAERLDRLGSRGPDVALVVGRRSHAAWARLALRSYRGDLGHPARHAWTTSHVLAPTAVDAAGGGGPDADLPPEHRRAVRLIDELCRRAQEGELIPFFGAGVNAGSGARWEGLLRRLQEQLDGLADLDLSELDTMQTAQAIANLWRQRQPESDLWTAVAREVTTSHRSLSQLLLANLPARHAITTNYDRGYELACQDAGEPVAVVPQPGGSRRLIKLHGDLPDDERITAEQVVLTLEQYLDEDAPSRVLAGAVQMLLLTGHLLFVGYSLRDPDLQRALHEVRRVVSSIEDDDPDVRPLATSLQLSPSHGLAAVWAGTVELLWPALDHLDEAARRPEAARQTELLLDLLVDASVDTTLAVLDPTVGPLDPPHEELRRALMDLREIYERNGSEHTALWRPVRDLLDRFSDATGEPDA